MADDAKILSDAERMLKERFNKSEADRQRLPSDAIDDAGSTRLDHLVLPDEMRPKMPLTKSQYLVRENPHLVQWERETRKFLRKLSPDHEHRVSASMVYEWATGMRITDIMAEETPRAVGETPNKPHTTWRGDLRKINKVLSHYFGKPYMTWIAGKKIPKAYKVRAGYLITRHRPLTLTLWTEYTEGVLSP